MTPKQPRPALWPARSSPTGTPVTAFVTNQNLPPTNNDAETAFRHAVIARRISYGTRTDEGSRAYAAVLSIVETCRRRKIDPWARRGTRCRKRQKRYQTQRDPRLKPGT